MAGGAVHEKRARLVLALEGDALDGQERVSLCLAHHQPPLLLLAPRIPAGQDIRQARASAGHATDWTICKVICCGPLRQVETLLKSSNTSPPKMS